MLILQRNHGQRILIGDDIVITVFELHGKEDSKGLRIGIDAPRNVRVIREELLPEPLPRTSHAPIPTIQNGGYVHA